MSTPLYVVVLPVSKKCFGIRNVHCYYIIMGKVCAIPNLPVYVVSCVISCKGNDNKPNTKGKQNGRPFSRFLAIYVFTEILYFA